MKPGHPNCDQPETNAKPLAISATRPKNIPSSNETPLLMISRVPSTELAA